MGLPQFDLSTYSSQLFWLIVCLTVLFVFVKRVFAPRLMDILETRERRIQGDLEKAQKMVKSAQEIQHNYDSQLEQNRVQARQQRATQLAEFAKKRQERLDRQQKAFQRKRVLIEKGGFVSLPEVESFAEILLNEEQSSHA